MTHILCQDSLIVILFLVVGVVEAGKDGWGLLSFGCSKFIRLLSMLNELPYNHLGLQKNIGGCLIQCLTLVYNDLQQLSEIANNKVFFKPYYRYLGV